MDEDPKKNNLEPETPETIDTGPMKVEEKSQKRLEFMLSTLQRGWKVSVLREQPSWCRGHLETIEYFGDEDETIEVDYLIRMWGGRRLHLKIHDEKGRWIGGGSISLFSYHPKVRGKIIKEEDVMGSVMGPQGTIQPAVPQYPQQQQPFDINQIMNLMSKQKGADVGSILKLLEYSQSKQQSSHQQNAMEQMMSMMQMFKQMKEMFGEMGNFGGGGGGGDGDDSGFSGMAADVLKSLITKQQTPAAPQRGALSAPRKPRPNLPLPQPHQPSPQLPQPVPSKPEVPESSGGEYKTVTQIARKVSDLSADDAAGVVLLALDGMSEEKRAKAMDIFVSNMSANDPLDDSNELDDNVDQDDHD